MSRRVVRQPSNLVGRVVGRRYRLLEQLGVGGMGAVYRGEHIHLGTIRALKVLHSEHWGNPTLVRRFLREARNLAQLAHPNIVEVVDTGETEDGLPFIAMEFLEGESLLSLLKKGPLSWPRVRRIAAQLCSALQAAHDSGIVHRDIKPENCICIECQNDTIKLLDFGIAKYHDESMRLTEAGQVIGTVPYMSCEQLQGQPCDHLSDQWSTAVTLYQLLTGALPFSGQNHGQLTYNIAHRDPQPVSQVIPELELPSALDGVLARALAKRKIDRYPSMRDFFSALEDLPDIAGSTKTVPLVTLPKTKKFSRRSHVGELQQADSNEFVVAEERSASSPQREEAAGFEFWMFGLLGIVVLLSGWSTIDLLGQGAGKPLSRPQSVQPVIVGQKAAPKPEPELLEVVPRTKAVPERKGNVAERGGDEVVETTPEQSPPQEEDFVEDAITQKQGTRDKQRSVKPKALQPCDRLQEVQDIQTCLEHCQDCRFPVKVYLHSEGMRVAGTNKSAVSKGGQPLSHCLALARNALADLRVANTEKCILSKPSKNE